MKQETICEQDMGMRAAEGVGPYKGMRIATAPCGASQ